MHYLRIIYKNLGTLNYPDLISLSIVAESTSKSVLLTSNVSISIVILAPFVSNRSRDSYAVSKRLSIPERQTFQGLILSP